MTDRSGNLASIDLRLKGIYPRPRLGLAAKIFPTKKNACPTTCKVISEFTMPSLGLWNPFLETQKIVTCVTCDEKATCGKPCLVDSSFSTLGFRDHGVSRDWFSIRGRQFGSTFSSGKNQKLNKNKSDFRTALSWIKDLGICLLLSSLLCQSGQAASVPRQSLRQHWKCR